MRGDGDKCFVVGASGLKDSMSEQCPGGKLGSSGG